MEYLYKKSLEPNNKYLCVLIENNDELYELYYSPYDYKTDEYNPYGGKVVSKVWFNYDGSLFKRTIEFGDNLTEERFDELVKMSDDINKYEEHKEYLYNKYMYDENYEKFLALCDNNKEKARQAYDIALQMIKNDIS